MGENRCYTEVDGRIVVEAEDYTERYSGRVTEWLVIPDEQDPPFDYSRYSGRGYLNVLPETDWQGPLRWQESVDCYPWLFL